MYLACVHFVDSVSGDECVSDMRCKNGSAKPTASLLLILEHQKIKTASLRWHSPMLDDISAVGRTMLQRADHRIIAASMVPYR